MKRTFYFRVDRNLKIQIFQRSKIQIPNGQKFKFGQHGGENFETIHRPPRPLSTSYYVLPKLQTVHNMVWGSLFSRTEPYVCQMCEFL